MQTSIKRCWNLSLWAGFLLVVAGVLSYIPIFALFPITRDFPWANLLLFLAGGDLLGRGPLPALRPPALYPRQILRPPPTALHAGGGGFFVFGGFFEVWPRPESGAAPPVGRK